MALVLLPGLTNLIDDISDEKKLAPQVVEAALREALLKGYERYRRTLYIGISEDPFDEDYFSNFDVGLDLEEEGYRVLASKIIVDEVESEDHQIALAEVMQVAEDAQAGDTVVLDVTPEKEDFGRMLLRLHLHRDGWEANQYNQLLLSCSVVTQFCRFAVASSQRPTLKKT